MTKMDGDANTSTRVRTVLDHDPMLRALLGKGIANVRKTARNLIEENNWDVTEESVVAAIRRYELPNFEDWSYVDEMNALYQIADVYRIIRSGAASNITLKDVYEKGDAALEKLEEMDSDRIEMGRMSLLSNYTENEKIKLYETVLTTASYFHKEWYPISAEAMIDLINEITGENHDQDSIKEVVEECEEKGSIKKSTEKGRILLIPSKEIEENIPDENIEGIDHLLNEIGYVYPPIDEPIEPDPLEVKKKLDELEFFPYSMENSVLKTGLLAILVDHGDWIAYRVLKDSITQLVGNRRSDMLIKKYISELENLGVVDSRGELVNTMYSPTEMARSIIENANSLDGIFETIEGLI